MRNEPSSRRSGADSRRRVSSAACVVAPGSLARASLRPPQRARRPGPAARRAPPEERRLRRRATLDSEPSPNVLRWQATAFVGPVRLRHRRRQLPSISPSRRACPGPTGDYCFELAGGDVLFGSLVGLDDERGRAGGAAPRADSTSSARRSAGSTAGESSADLIYLGPNGLAGWHEPSAKKVWREEQGQPWTDQDGAAIRGDFELPARATLEFEISWKNKPDFVLALGVGDDDEDRSSGPSGSRSGSATWSSSARPSRRPTWPRWARSPRGRARPSPGLPRPGARADPGLLGRRQAAGRPEGRQRASPQVAGRHLAGQHARRRPAGTAADRPVERRAAARGRARQVAHPPGRRLDRLRAGQPVRRRVEGVRDRRGAGRVPDPRGSGRRRVPVAPRSEPTAAIACRGLPGRLAAQRRARQGGEADARGSRSRASRSPWLAAGGPAVAGRRSRHEAQPRRRPASDPACSRWRASACPAAWSTAASKPGSSCLVWQPQGSATASPLRPGVSGRIVYREPPPAATTARQPAQRQAAPASRRRAGSSPGSSRRSPGQELSRRRRRRKRTVALPAHRRRHPVARSRRSTRTASPSGPRSPTSTFVAHDKVKAVELAAEANPDRQAQQGEARAPAHASPDAEGEPADAPDPLQERRLPPRPADQDGRQDAPGRGPAGDEGVPRDRSRGSSGSIPTSSITPKGRADRTARPRRRGCRPSATTASG